jgi:hypothetical protein
MANGRLERPTNDHDCWGFVGLANSMASVSDGVIWASPSVVILLMGLDSLSVGIKALSWCSQHRSGPTG